MTGSALRAIRARLVAADGVTLTEMLVVLAILLILVTSMTTLFVSASNSQVDQTNRVEGQRNARLALDALRSQIRCGSAVPSVSPSSITVTVPARCQKPAGAGPASFTWCAVGVGAPYTLMRYVGTACPGTPTGTPLAESLYSNQVFALNGQNPVGAPTLTAAKTGSEVVFTSGRYAYSVTAIVSGGKEIPGTIASKVIGADSTNRMTLTWPAYTAESVSQYRVYGRDDGASTAAGLRLLATVPATTFTYTDLGATAGSPDSPPPVTGTSAPPRATLSITLEFDASPNNGLQRFKLEDDIVLRNSGRH